MASGTGWFMPLTAAEPNEQGEGLSCSGGQRRRGSRHGSRSRSRLRNSQRSNNKKQGTTWPAPDDLHHRSNATARRVPWVQAGAVGAAPLQSSASSSALAESLDDDGSTFLSSCGSSGSLPACLPGAGGEQAWCSLGSAISTGMVQPSAAWLPALAGGGLGEPAPGLGLPAAAGGGSSVLIQLPPASAPPALGVSGSVGGLGLGAAGGGGALPPELCSSTSLASWNGAASNTSGQLLTSSSEPLPQLAGAVADARVLDSIEAELSALLQLRDQLAAARQSAAATAVAPVPMLAPWAGAPAVVPAAEAARARGLMSAMAQCKLQQLAAMQAAEAQLWSEVAVLLPLL